MVFYYFQNTIFYLIVESAVRMRQIVVKEIFSRSVNIHFMGLICDRFASLFLFIYFHIHFNAIFPLSQQPEKFPFSFNKRIFPEKKVFFTRSNLVRLARFIQIVLVYTILIQKSTSEFIKEQQMASNITATTDATTTIPHASILAQLLIGTRLLRLIGTTDTTSSKNNGDILFLNELSSAVGMVLNEMHRYYVPSFSNFPHNVGSDMHSIIISPKKDHPTIKQTLKCMSERNKEALFDPSKQKEDNVPVSLVALNTKV